MQAVEVASEAIVASSASKIDTNKKNTPWSESASELYGPSDQRLSEKLVPTFAYKMCHVVSLTKPYDRILDISRSEPLLFLPSSSSIELMRLSGPRSRPTTS
jgi:hypothetical protein